MSAPERCFVDTNVWLYAFIRGQDASKTGQAATLLQNRDIVVSVQVINEVCINLLKKAAIDEAAIRQLITSFFIKYRVVPLDEPVLAGASELRERYSLSFWDGLIVAAALASGAEVLYTEDLQHGLLVENRLRVVNPFLPTT
jgi:predicted nucleic acid-binding protein